MALFRAVNRIHTLSAAAAIRRRVYPVMGTAADLNPDGGAAWASPSVFSYSSVPKRSQQSIDPPLALAGTQTDSFCGDQFYPRARLSVIDGAARESSG
jgi:hypothetical protein